MWTHALARDYDEMESIMFQFPDEIMHVRHYQGHWYKNNDLLNSMEEKEAPLSKTLMDEVITSILSSNNPKTRQTKMLIYQKARDVYGASTGVEWITPVERPAKYHKNKM